MAESMYLWDKKQKYYFNRIWYKDNNKLKEFKYLYTILHNKLQCIFMNFQTDKGKKYKTTVFTSTTTNFTPPRGTRSMDVFCVGGGQAGGYGDSYMRDTMKKEYSCGGQGGNGGSTMTTNIILLNEKNKLDIYIGGGGSKYAGMAAGGESYIMKLNDDGVTKSKVASSNNTKKESTYSNFNGSGGGSNRYNDYSDGSSVSRWTKNYGSNGASNGANSAASIEWSTENKSGYYHGWNTSYIYGQNVTTRAFEESDGTLYAGGGGGGGCFHIYNGQSTSGSDGGGNGAKVPIDGGYPNWGADATANTGSGGGGGSGHGDTKRTENQSIGGNGGSGIIIIRFYGTTKRED